MNDETPQVVTESEKTEEPSNPIIDQPIVENPLPPPLKKKSNKKSIKRTTLVKTPGAQTQPPIRKLSFNRTKKSKSIDFLNMPDYNFPMNQGANRLPTILTHRELQKRYETMVQDLGRLCILMGQGNFNSIQLYNVSVKNLINELNNKVKSGQEPKDDLKLMRKNLITILYALPHLNTIPVIQK